MKLFILSKNQKQHILKKANKQKYTTPNLTNPKPNGTDEILLK